jgi:hypothetical protein
LDRKIVEKGPVFVVTGRKATKATGKIIFPTGFARNPTESEAVPKGFEFIPAGFETITAVLRKSLRGLRLSPRFCGNPHGV